MYCLFVVVLFAYCLFCVDCLFIVCCVFVVGLLLRFIVRCCSCCVVIACLLLFPHVVVCRCVVSSCAALGLALTTVACELLPGAADCIGC